MAYKDEVCSKAALYIGDVPFTDISVEEGAAPVALNGIYDQIYHSLLASYPWSFALKIDEVTTPEEWVSTVDYAVGDYVSNDGDNYRCTAINGTSTVAYEPGTTTGWEDYWELSILSGSSYNHLQSKGYGYEIVQPSDVIRIWEILPHSISFEIVSDGATVTPKHIILSNTDKITLKYVYAYAGTPPDYFSEALAYALASKIALSVTEDAGTQQIMRQEYQSAWSIAKSIDSQGKQSVALISSPFTDVR